MPNIPDVIVAPRTDRIYNCHAYLTKVPVAAIRPFIEEFTSPGEVVLDPFAGSGMTGISATMSGRRAWMSDISALGQHIALGYLTEVDVKEFRETSEAVVAQARKAIGDFYTTRRSSDGQPAEMIRTVWSFTYVCPKCKKEMVYFKALRNGGTAQPDACPGCKTRFEKRSWQTADDVPVQVVVHGEAGRQVEQEPQEIDWRSIEAAKKDGRQEQVPSLPIDESREMYRRSALGKHGLPETKSFFSPRNAIALMELWRAIERVEKTQMKRKLQFAFTAILPRASRRYQWSAQRPLNAQNQTYYISPVYYEWNIFELFQRKVEAAIRSDDEVFRGMPLFANSVKVKAKYDLSSADSLTHLKNSSVDYIFTDPPFGSNIFYSDMNLFQEAWLGTTTDPEREAVMHTTGKKKNGAAERYETLLQGAFSEAYRVLKPGRFMSVVFGNSSGNIWGLVQRALRAAGFDSTPTHVAILDKGQRSVKGLNSGSEGVVTVDLVLTIQKPSNGSNSPKKIESRQADPNELLKSAITQLDETKARNPSYVYAAVIREAIKRHQLVDHLHFTDVLIALRNTGYIIDPKTGLLNIAHRAMPQTSEADSASANLPLFR